jgi:hypothetical protein
MGSLLSVSSGPDHNPCQINAIVESVTVQITRGEEVGTDEEQDDAGLFEVLVDDLVPLGARPDAAVVPAADDPLVLQQAQMGFEPLLQSFVPV